MTTAQKKGLQYAAALIGMVATVSFSAGVSAYGARHEIEAKEDKLTHEISLRALSDSVREDRRKRELQSVRDSALMATILERATDAACDRNPRRKYC